MTGLHFGEFLVKIWDMFLSDVTDVVIARVCDLFMLLTDFSKRKVVKKCQEVHREFLLGYLQSAKL